MISIIMKHIRKYGSLIFRYWLLYSTLLAFMLNCFTLGLYTMSVKYNIKPVEPHQWFLTSMFGIFFLICFIDYLKKDLK
jgi:hypothetical protein